MPPRSGNGPRVNLSSSASGREGDASVVVHRLGADVARGGIVQAVVPEGAWQSAQPLGAWALVGCIVTPAFEYEGFELAPPGWTPPVGA